MSHVTTMEIEIADIAALREAAAEFGGELLNKQTYEWFGQTIGDYPLPSGMTVDMLGKCDLAIKLPGVRYEVGVVKQPNGKYTLAYDYYGSPYGTRHDGHKLLERFGTPGAPKKGLHRLVQAYSVRAVTRAARKQGYQVQRKQGKNGAVQVVVTGIR